MYMLPLSDLNIITIKAIHCMGVFASACKNETHAEILVTMIHDYYMLLVDNHKAINCPKKCRYYKTSWSRIKYNLQTN